MHTDELLLLNQAQIMDRTARRFQDREALRYDGGVMTWGELHDASFRLAKAFLKAGIKKGDRVGIMMTNIPEWVVTRNAINCVGAWLVPINTRYKTSELKTILSLGEVNALVLMDQALDIDFVGLLNAVCPGLASCAPGATDLHDLPFLKTVVCLGKRGYPGMHEFAQFMDSAAEMGDEEVYAAMNAVSPHDVSTLLFTSGTTGLPKGVLTTHYQFTRGFHKVGVRFGLTENDVHLGGTPFFTNFGLCTVLILSELFGSKISIFETFDTARIIEGIERDSISVFAGTTAMFNMILNHPDFTPEKVRSMRVGDIGGAPFTPQLVRDIRDKLGMTIFAAYGMTENSGLTTFSEIGDSEELVANTVGTKFNEGCEIKIVDVVTRREVPPGERGEILTRGWHVTQGYYKNPELFARSKDEQGWFLTGDLGTVDENGYYKIVGRLKDLIVSGGLNIDPAEVENLLVQHPAVAGAFVVGLPDPRMVEVVGAFIELKEGKVCTAQEITAFCDGKIGKYKIPKYVHFITEVPRTAAGKVQKFKLRELGLQAFNLTGC